MSAACPLCEEVGHLPQCPEAPALPSEEARAKYPDVHSWIGVSQDTVRPNMRYHPLPGMVEKKGRFTDGQTGKVHEYSVWDFPPGHPKVAILEAIEVKRRSDRVAALPKDLDGDLYVVDETLGAWKVTPCCGASVKGVESGIVCRSCYADMSWFPDGPARLKPDDPPVPPARETAVVVRLP